MTNESRHCGLKSGWGTSAPIAPTRPPVPGARSDDTTVGASPARLAAGCRASKIFSGQRYLGRIRPDRVFKAKATHLLRLHSPHSSPLNEFRRIPTRPTNTKAHQRDQQNTKGNSCHTPRTEAAAGKRRIAAATFSSICIVATAPEPRGARHECPYIIRPLHGGRRSVDWLETAPAGLFGGGRSSVALVFGGR